MTNTINVTLDPGLTLEPPTAKRLGMQDAGDGSRLAPEANIADYPKRFTQHCSDHAKQSPWKGKLLLSLDGGGVRGYSSLLILQKLISLIAVLENGHQAMSYRNTSYRFTSHTKSEDSQDGAILHGGVQNPIGDGTTHSDTISTSKYLIHHYFDYVAGTSTGGLSAIMLSRLQMDVAKALDQYRVFGDQVFAHPSTFQVAGILRPKYKTKKVESAIRDVICNCLPETKKSSKSVAARAAIIQLANDNRHACHTAVIAKGGDVLDRPYIFRSYDHIDTSPLKDDDSHHFNPGPAHQTKLWEVARATSAAPRYFDKMVIGHDDFIDGGVGTNNPADRVRQDVYQVLGDPPELIVSIGTGVPPASNEGDRKKPMRMPRALRRAQDFFSVVSKLAKIATESEETHNRLEKGSHELRKKRAEDHGYPMYFRFNAPDITDIKLDEWRVSQGKNKTLKALTKATQKYLMDDEVNKRLQECAIELVRIRRERARTERWESFATNTTYKCPETIEGDPVKHRTRDELRQHALISHEYVAWATLDGQHLCTLDNCAMTPVPVENEPDFLKHLKDYHGMHDPVLKEPSALEAWLDSGNPDRLSQQNGDLTGSSRTQEGNAIGRNDNSTTESQHQQGLGPPAEQVAGAQSSSDLNGEATGESDGNTVISQQQQRQSQVPTPSAEQSPQAGPSNWQHNHRNSDTTAFQQIHAQRSPVEQTAGAEQPPEQNSNGESPVRSSEIPSSRPLATGRPVAFIDRAPERKDLFKVKTYPEGKSRA